MRIHNTNNLLDYTYDGCGNTAIAVLEIHGSYIPICSNCLEELISSIEDFCDDNPEYDTRTKTDPDSIEENIDSAMRLIKLHNK